MTEWDQIDFSGPKGEPKLTLRKNMQIGMNNTFVKKYQIDNYDGVEVFVAKDKKKIAFKFSASSDAEKKTKIQKRPNNYHFTVTELRNLFEIDARKCEFGPVNYNQGEDLFIVDVVCKEA
jgi:hypothetical protein